MNQSAMSAVAVFGGAAVGSLSPVLSNYVLQRRVARRDLVNREISERQKLYAKFISAAARLHADAMTKSAFDLGEVVRLYALTSRIRLVAQEDVVHAAEDMVKTIVQRYGETNLSLDDFRQAAVDSKLDPLKRFSAACRRDLLRLFRAAG
ncbi:hypothetical protein SAMN05421819_1298 [Bryocella elongata]|uniref:Uncharacterized protein n=1 Tax=Bryocella elongata TaxID=863522 RepID=A0A1H5VSR8_9BACT|nr:hypothetical protein [Bryocella elongata]SEF90365.1 hypothetical protein SAMN05421819_1298 [Bryocella elongata]